MTFLIQLIEIIKNNPQITTGVLIEYWRGQKEEPLVTQLARWEHMIPDSGLKSEFLGALRQLSSLGLDEEINYLLAKGAQQSLTEEEKQQLTNFIAKKKAIV
jgi:DNA primase